MSTKTHLSQWNQARFELTKLVQSENDSSPTSKSSPPLTKLQVKTHYASLYHRYNAIYDTFLTCHDFLIQPQIRMDLQETLVLVIGRLLHLRHVIQMIQVELVKDIRAKQEERDMSSSGENTSKPMENEPTVGYLAPSQILEDDETTNCWIPLQIPNYMSREEELMKRTRDEMVLGYCQLQRGTCELPPVVQIGKKDEEEERDRNAEQQQDLIQQMREMEESKKRHRRGTTSCHGNSRPVPPSSEMAVVCIQAHIRGYACRMQNEKYRIREETLIGMRKDLPCRSNEDDNDWVFLKKFSIHQNQLRYESEEDFNKALTKLTKMVREQEGFAMKRKLQEERMNWIVEQIAETNEVPESIDKFYNKSVMKDEVSSYDKDSVGKSKRESKKKGGNGEKDSKSKDTNTEQANFQIETPVNIIQMLHKSVERQNQTWSNPRYCTSTHDSPFSEELAKDTTVRLQIQEETRKFVDQALMLNLGRIQEMHPNGKKKGKEKSSKSKGKKSGKKKKKDKPLPGAKIEELKGMDNCQFLSILIQHGLINSTNGCRLSDLVGFDSSDLAPHKLQKESFNKDKYWQTINPSLSSVRNAICEYCILPLGTQHVRDSIDDSCKLRSILLYGTPGCGKTEIAQVIATELGALLINLSPSRIPQEFLANKTASTKLIHMAFSIAKDPMFSPCIIYLDECEQHFQSVKKKSKQESNSASRFQKDLLIYKNQFLTKDDRVLIIGCTSFPSTADMKVLKWKGPKGKPDKQGFFEKFLHIHPFDYTERVVSWRYFVMKKIPLDNASAASGLNFGTLAQFSTGFSIGSIKQCVDKVLTAFRVGSLNVLHLKEEEFINELLKSTMCLSNEEYEDFTKRVHITAVKTKKTDSSKKKK